MPYTFIVWFQCLPKQSEIEKCRFVSAFDRTDQILISLGMTEMERFTTYKMMSAILHLGNIDFEDTDSGVHVIESTKEHVTIASTLLNISSDDLEKSILCRSIQVPGSIIMYAYLLFFSMLFHIFSISLIYVFYV